MIKILIVGTQKLFRDGLSSILTQRFDGSINIYETDADSAFAVCSELMPDLLLLDVDNQIGIGLELASRLVNSSPTKVIIITGKSEPNLLNLLIETHAVGYLTKSSSGDGLIRAVNHVIEGTTYVSEEYSQLVTLGKIDGLSIAPLSELSIREMEVMVALAEGRSPEEIAKILFISSKTVASYKQRIHEKLNTRNTADITRIAIQSGLLAST